MKQSFKSFLALNALIIMAFMTFAVPPSYDLTINVVGHGSVEFDYDAIRKAMPDPCTNLNQPCVHFLFESGYILEPTASFGWEFAGWTGDISSATKAEKTADGLLYIYLDGNKTVTATFTAIDYELNTFALAPAGGIVSADPQKDYYNMGDHVELRANNNPGYVFKNWSGNFTEVLPDKISSSMNNPILIVINGDTDITANFEPVQHAVPISPWAIVFIMGLILSFVVYRFKVRS